MSWFRGLADHNFCLHFSVRTPKEDQVSPMDPELAYFLETLPECVVKSVVKSLSIADFTSQHNSVSDSCSRT